MPLQQLAAPSAPRRGAPAAASILHPQQLLRDAHAGGRLAARHGSPQGLGLDSSVVRARMVARLRAGGVTQEAVLRAFGRVPRHLFVDGALANQAYEETSLPIGWSQTISKPAVVARMLGLLCDGEAARARGHLGRVLEVGTGCGYQTALLATLAGAVVSIERIQPLQDRARETLDGLGLRGLHLLHADGRLGHPPRAPYDSVLSAAGGDDVPPAWLDQLAVGGRLVAPVVDSGRGGQGLLVIDRSTPGSGGLSRRWLEAVHFVPLKSGTE